MDETWWRSATELDDEQRNAIQIPTSEGNFLILGPPGSGKTNILLLRASYLKAAGLGNCLVLAFTRTLREFIAAGSNLPSMLPQDRIRTHAAWSLQFLEQVGRRKRQPNSEVEHDEARNERHYAVAEAVRELGIGDDYYDAILLDEVQDYWKCEIDLLASLTPRLFSTGDQRQRIFDRNEGIQAARDASSETIELLNHYRMGRKICRVADRLISATQHEPLENHCQYDERELPSRVSVHRKQNSQSQFELLAENLSNQLRAYPEGWLGVFAVRRSARDEVMKFLQGTSLKDHLLIQSDDSALRAFNPAKRIVISTLHAAKGTEFRCVHFVSADDFPHFTREKAFTAVTRAKTTLDVYHTDHLDGPLEAALANRTVPNLNEILQ